MGALLFPLILSPVLGWIAGGVLAVSYPGWRPRTTLALLLAPCIAVLIALVTIGGRATTLAALVVPFVLTFVAALAWKTRAGATRVSWSELARERHARRELQLAQAGPTPSAGLYYLTLVPAILGMAHYKTHPAAALAFSLAPIAIFVALELLTSDVDVRAYARRGSNHLVLVISVGWLYPILGLRGLTKMPRTPTLGVAALALVALALLPRVVAGRARERELQGWSAKQ